MNEKIYNRAGCTAISGENNYSRSPLTDSYPDSSKEWGVCASELKGICNGYCDQTLMWHGVNTSEL